MRSASCVTRCVFLFRSMSCAENVKHASACMTRVRSNVVDVRKKCVKTTNGPTTKPCAVRNGPRRPSVRFVPDRVDRLRVSHRCHALPRSHASASASRTEDDRVRGCIHTHLDLRLLLVALPLEKLALLVLSHLLPALLDDAAHAGSFLARSRCRRRCRRGARCHTRPFSLRPARSRVERGSLEAITSRHTVPSHRPRSAESIG